MTNDNSKKGKRTPLPYWGGEARRRENKRARDGVVAPGVIPGVAALAQRLVSQPPRAPTPAKSTPSPKKSVTPPTQKQASQASRATSSPSSPPSPAQPARPSQPPRLAGPTALPDTPENKTCPECQKLFKTRTVLLQHLRESHIGTTCFWEGCGATLASEQGLNIHLREHNTAAGDHMKCNWPECNTAFSTKEMVARHLRRHTVKARNAQAGQSK
ncbi:uncharacterized protein F4822DRAFT_444070 [Hypoxylon trugodes]|uniref:uncharacterized protein n=1 Tax=Hypoxylon trugodes TaxID=326681 RepID=UPI0021A05821|nr:uncharacterized protein F4822DRAFT_444070 [Hypoxylon trugodes]KAI1387303.1 hypothetical protein F4822DRAFT_444070 [Hypoxylon trugodes]